MREVAAPINQMATKIAEEEHARVHLPPAVVRLRVVDVLVRGRIVLPLHPLPLPLPLPHVSPPLLSSSPCYATPSSSSPWRRESENVAAHHRDS
jgi:hypothetical protein